MNEIKKPEKKVVTKYKECSVCGDRYINEKDAGYNQACDDYEKFLPSEEEIRQILETPNFDISLNDKLKEDLAKAISKRIRSEG